MLRLHLQLVDRLQFWARFLYAMVRPFSTDSLVLRCVYLVLTKRSTQTLECYEVIRRMTSIRPTNPRVQKTQPSDDFAL